MTKLARADFDCHFQDCADSLLAAIIDQNADCVKLIGLDGTLEYVNRAGCNARRIDDIEDAIGKPWWTLWPNETQDQVRQSVQKARKGESVRFEARWPTGDGDPLWWDVNISPIRDSSGTLCGLVAISRDITSMIQARETAQAMAAEMAHRLRNAYAITSSLLCAAARGDPAREEFAREISEQFMRLGAAQTLMLSKGGSAISLASLVAELTRGFAGEAAPIEIGAMPDVMLDDRKLQPLALTIGELCTNSAKYGALGHGGGVTVSSTRQGQQLTIRWSEHSEKPVDRREREGGTGFPLIRRVLAAQKGTIEIDWRDDGLDAVVSMMVD